MNSETSGEEYLYHPCLLLYGLLLPYLMKFMPISHGLKLSPVLICRFVIIHCGVISTMCPAQSFVGYVHTCCTTFPFVPGSLMNFGQTFKASSWVHFDVYWLHFGFILCSITAAFLFYFWLCWYFLKLHCGSIGFGLWFECINMGCFLWFEDTSHGYASLLVCH
jgi:hypothetical protein